MSAYPQTAYPEPETPRPIKQPTPSPGPLARSRNNTVLTSEPSSSTRREPNARVSFFDPANQAALDRLLSGDVIRGDEFDEGTGEGEVAEEAAQAMLNSVEEMLEGYEWGTGDLFGTGRGTTDQIESRLVGELMALEKVRWQYAAFKSSNLPGSCRRTFIRSLNLMIE